MFERFTDQARRTVVLAQDEARSLNHSYLGTEHLLLGLLREGEGVAAKSLESFGVSSESVRNAVKEIIGRGDDPPRERIAFTPRTKTVLEVSLRQAVLLGHTLVGTEHLLLALIRDTDDVATQVLLRLGVDLERLRNETLHRGPGPGGSAAAEERAATDERDSLLGRVSAVFDENYRLKRDIARLRILLEENGIDPDDNAGSPDS